ncbi:MAG: serine/threonine-protein kinase [Dehalococcoidia bacterium]
MPQGAARCPACGTAFAARAPAGVAQARVAAAAEIRSRAAAALVNRAAVQVHTPHGPAVACPAPHKHPTTSPPPPRTAGRSASVQAAGRGPHRTAAPAHPQVLAENTSLAGGRYKLGPVLGRGSFGITYRGIDDRLDRPIAIKEFFPEGSYRQNGAIVPPSSLGRTGYEAERDHFIQEARVLAKFQRPGIVSVYEVFEENDTAYMVMEYLAGRTLADVLRERGEALPVADALRYVLAVADALAAVHEQHLLHRDVKPGNVMLTPSDQAVLIDFGAARRYDRYQRTSVMTAIGTPGYAPLEQWGSSGRFGPSSDVYALAATLYHLIAGSMPASAADRAIDETLRPPHELVRAVPVAVSAVILHGLAVRMEDRPQTMAAFAAELRAARSVQSQGSNPSGPPGNNVTPRLSAPPTVPPAAPPPRPRAAVPEQRLTVPQAAAPVPVSQPSVPATVTAPRGRRLRARWPRRRLHLFAWAGASVFAPVFFATSIITVTAVLPVLGVLALACTGDLRRAARISLRSAAQVAEFGFSACGVSVGSLCVVAGLTVRGAAKTAMSVLCPG